MSKPKPIPAIIAGAIVVGLVLGIVVGMVVAPWTRPAEIKTISLPGDTITVTTLLPPTTVETTVERTATITTTRSTIVTTQIVATVTTQTQIVRTTPTTTATATGEALAVDAHTFYEEYKTDEKAADTKYLFKVVQVTGEIASLDLVLYEVVYGSDEVVCSFVQTRETEGSKLATLRVGDVVTIEGKCLGRFHVAPYCVYLSECTLVSVVTKAETSATTSTATQTASATTVTTATTSVSYKYVGSVNSNVYHYPWCSYAKRIKPENQIWFIDENDAKSKGYRPCSVCSPPG